MKAFKMARPKTLAQAVAVAAGDAATTGLLAGGTDLLGLLKDRVSEPDVVVNLKSIPGLTTIERSDRGLEIGALATLTDVAEHAEISSGWPALRTTVEKTATPQIRNVATVGGNLCQRPRCWYFRHEDYPCLKKGGELCYAREGENEYHAIFDNATCNIIHPSNLAPVLIAYDATVDIAGPDGVETVAVEEMFVSPEEDIARETILEPGQVVTRVTLPTGSARRHAAYFEAREKQSYDWALCGATVSLSLRDGVVEDARIVLSAVAPTPVRRTDLEDMVRGKKPREATIDAVCEAAVQGATPLRDNGYKVILLKGVLRRAFRQAIEG